jgi:hypothetical protein
VEMFLKSDQNFFFKLSPTSISVVKIMYSFTFIENMTEKVVNLSTSLKRLEKKHFPKRQNFVLSGHCALYLLTTKNLFELFYVLILSIICNLDQS